MVKAPLISDRLFVSKINASAIMAMGPDAVKRHPIEHNCWPCISLETVVFTFLIDSGGSQEPET